MKRGTLGSISHATLRAEDLIPAFYDALKELVEGDEHETILSEAEDIIGREDWEQEDNGEVIADLEYALGEAAPPYCYFGASEGDGSDFGFWINYEEIEDAILSGDLLKVSDLSEIPEYWKKEVLLVNDHGNSTLYEPRVVFEESWSIV